MMLSSCTSQETRPGVSVDTSDIHKIIVLPFQDMTKSYGTDINVRSPLTGLVMMTGYVPDTAAPFLTSTLISLLQTHQEFTILSPDETWNEAVSHALSSSDSGEADLTPYIQAGKQAGADAVFTGHIFRYIDRKGNRLSVEHPASVAFDLHLIRVADGQMIWNGHFEETQKPLSENVLDLGMFIKRKGSWVTADELAQGGLEDLLGRFLNP